MNATARLVFSADSRPAPRFDEVDDVRLTRSLESRSGHLIAAGSIGTVMLVHGDGDAYEVEFGPEPDDLLTVNVEDLEKAPSAV